METKVKKYRLVNTEGYVDLDCLPDDRVVDENFMFVSRPVKELVEKYPRDWELVEGDPVADQPLPVRGQLIQVRDFEGDAWRPALFDRFEGWKVWCFGTLNVRVAFEEKRLPSRRGCVFWRQWRFIDWDE